ncbi:MAG TPA: AMP-binding protein [Sporichthyaceae bacterium]|nr:AMP-binding protein [Sporichthyaceae bacterium]
MLPTPANLRRCARALQSATTNAVEIARSGGLATGEQPNPFTVVRRTPMFRLRRYFPGECSGPAVLLIPPLMMSTEVYDVSPATSAVGILAAHGVDPWVVDFGAPEREEGGLGRNVADHIVAVSEAVDLVRNHTGTDVHLAGYSQGGMFAYQAAAYRRSVGLVSVITFGAPVDWRATRASRAFGPFNEDMVVDVMSVVADRVLVHLTVPAWANRLGFRLLDPVKSVRTRLAFLRQLHDRDALLPRERQRQFLDHTGYVAYPGPAIAELVKQFVAQNRMLAGGIAVGDVLASLADITCPVLAFVGTVDTIAPPAAVRAIARAAPAAASYECRLATGHFGLVVGGGASTHTWPTVAAWANRENAALPAGVLPMEDTEAEPARLPGPIGIGLEGGATAISAVRASAGALLDGARSIGSVGLDAVRSMPNLSRLELLRSQTRVSLGSVLSERARRNPADVFFVFAGRGHTYAAANARVDAVVSALLTVGVRQGEHVGVLMRTRPSALSAVAALNRIGATVALLRPDGPSAREAELAAITRVVADAEHAQAAARLGVPVLVLGSSTAGGTLPPGAVDLETLAAGPQPAWYQPNPGTAAETAFLLFAGQGDTTRITPVSNGRWALSAFGTASAARLRPTDTVYSITPLHHPSGLLTGVGGSLAGGARLAMAVDRDPSTFWAEVRRYGVTVVSYTWTLLAELIEAEPTIGERHHPVRLFLGSGMPGWLWQRARDRFPSVAVLEFFAAGSTGVVLVNADGAKIGAKGRPLPGSAPVRLVRYDLAERRIATDARGLAIEAAVGEIGLLVARPTAEAVGDRALRGLFAPGDRWVSTDHLFRRDADGDHWLIGHVSELVTTDGGVAAPSLAEEALGGLDAVASVAAYPAAVPGGAQRLVAAVKLRPGRRLIAAEVDAVTRRLARVDRPAVIRVVADIPLTTWWRADREALRRSDAAAGSGVAGWVRDAAGGYRATPDPVPSVTSG